MSCYIAPTKTHGYYLQLHCSIYFSPFTMQNVCTFGYSDVVRRVTGHI
jgi:hypothetical protein